MRRGEKDSIAHVLVFSYCLLMAFDCKAVVFWVIIAVLGLYGRGGFLSLCILGFCYAHERSGDYSGYKKQGFIFI